MQSQLLLNSSHVWNLIEVHLSDLLINKLHLSIIKRLIIACAHVEESVICVLFVFNDFTLMVLFPLHSHLFNLHSSICIKVITLSLICLSEAINLSNVRFPWWLQGQLSVLSVKYSRGTRSAQEATSFLSEVERDWLAAAYLVQGELVGFTNRSRGDCWVQIPMIWYIRHLSGFLWECKENYDIDFWGLELLWCHLLLSHVVN